MIGSSNRITKKVRLRSGLFSILDVVQVGLLASTAHKVVRWDRIAVPSAGGLVRPGHCHWIPAEVPTSDALARLEGFPAATSATVARLLSLSELVLKLHNEFDYVQ